MRRKKPLIKDRQSGLLGQETGVYKWEAAFGSIFTYVTVQFSQTSYKLGRESLDVCALLNMAFRRLQDERSNGPSNGTRRKGGAMPEVWLSGSCGKEISQDR
jgi:hypothetical protein